MDFAAFEDDEWSAVLELEGVGMMDLPNGQSSITTNTATISEVRARPPAWLVFVVFVVHFQKWNFKKYLVSIVVVSGNMYLTVKDSTNVQIFKLMQFIPEDLQ